MSKEYKQGVKDTVDGLMDLICMYEDRVCDDLYEDGMWCDKHCDGDFKKKCVYRWLKVKKGIDI